MPDLINIRLTKDSPEIEAMVLSVSLFETKKTTLFEIGGAKGSVIF